MKNTLNTIKKTAKKQTKNIALASALIATLGSCGNKTENTQTTSTDSIKTEQVEKVDTLTNQDSININDLENIEGDADEILKEMGDVNPYHTETQKNNNETKKNPREEAGLTEADWRDFEKIERESGEHLKRFASLDEHEWDDPEIIENAWDVLEFYISACNILMKDKSKESKIVKKKYEQNKHKLKKK